MRIGKQEFSFSLILSLLIMLVFSNVWAQEEYTPPPGFPWSPPYTAEQIMYLADSAWQKGYKTYDMDALELEMDARGYIRQRFTMRRRMLFYDDYADLLNYKGGKLKLGDVRKKDIILFLTPPAMRGQAILQWSYKQSPSQRKNIDFWVYIPSLRKIRRLATGDRADAVAGGDVTYDDIGQREVFDETHTLIGEDILPQGPTIPEEKDCYVIESINKDPKYYLSKRISWVGKDCLCTWREEQYDRKGYLIRILEKRFEKISGVITATMWNDWNVQRNFRQAIIIFNHQFHKPMSEAEFLPPYLLKEFPWRKPDLSQVPFINGSEEFPAPPPLLRDRFPKYRKIKLPEELEREILQESK
jgi:hypothetical protein